MEVLEWMDDKVFEWLMEEDETITIGRGFAW